MGYMVVRGEETTRIFLNEIGILILENSAISLTGYLLAALTEKKVKVIFCDEKRLPFGELVPYHGSHDTTRKIREQITWTDSCKGAVWSEIVYAKIASQARHLEDCDLAPADAVFDYMTLVRELEGERLFIFVGLRSWLTDEEAQFFTQTALQHQFHFLLIDSSDYPRLANEIKITVDRDLCVF